MAKTVKIYNINSESAANNLDELSDFPDYFYWDIKGFVSDDIGSEVFFICKRKEIAFYSVIEELGIKVSFNGRETTFNDRGKEFKATGDWESFVRFRIKERVQIPSDWEFKNPLGKQNPVNYLYKPNTKFADANVRVSRLEDLKTIFISTSTVKRIDEVIEKLIGKNLPLPQQTPPRIEKTTLGDFTDIINKIYEYIINSGFQYELNDIKNFYLSLKTKPFVILAGISGTGKTKLVKLFAEAIGYGDDKHCLLLPVRPDWTDSSDLFGYTDLKGDFKKQKLFEFIETASDSKDEIFFVILDEMNLARVEYYFSEFLSIIETRKWNNKEINTSAIINGLTLPENVYIVGTVNMDETTHPFSKKVLDRANSIEINEVNLDWLKGGNEDPEIIEDVYNDFLKADYITSRDISEDEKDNLKEVILFLNKLNGVLEEMDLQFGYRVRDELAFYVLNSKYILDPDLAIDYQLMQKILPRINGSANRLGTVILKLIETLANLKLKDPNSGSYDTLNYEEVKKKVDNVQSRYPRSLKKLLFMFKRFEIDGFTSFWM